MNQFTKKVFSFSLFAAIPFVTMDCKKEKKDNTPAMALAAVALSQSSAASSASGTTTLAGAGQTAATVTNSKTGASTLVASKSLNVVSSQGINSNLSIKDALPYVSSMLRQTTVPAGIADKATLCNTTSGTLKDSEYCAFKPEVVNTDPLKSELSLLDVLFRIMGKTGYEWVVDKGNVKVTFTAPKTNSSSTGSVSGSSSSSSNTKTVQKSTWIVNAAYTDGKTPLVVKAWGDMEAPGSFGGSQKADAKIKLTITEPKSEKNPLGTFELNADLDIMEPDYTKLASASTGTSTGTSTSTSSGSTTMPRVEYVKRTRTVTLRSLPSTDGAVNLEMIEKFQVPMPKDMNNPSAGFTTVDIYRWVHGVFTPPKDVTKAIDDAGQVSFGYASDDPEIQKMAGGESYIGSVAWSPNYIYSKIPGMSSSAGEAPKAIENALKRKDPRVVVQSYGLFNKKDGSKFLLNSGFPIKSSDGTKEGWAGRYSISYFPKFDPNADPTTAGTVSFDPSANSAQEGEKVIQQKFDGTAGAEFTVKTYPGRLIRLTKGKVPISDLSGIEIDYWQNNSNSKIKWNDTKKSWEVVKKSCQWSMTGQTCTDISSTPEDVTIGFWYYDQTAQQSKKKAIRWDGVNSKFMITATCTVDQTTWVDTCTKDATETELKEVAGDFNFSAERITGWKANEAAFRLYLPSKNGGQGKSLEWNPSVDAANAITFTEREVDNIADEIKFLKGKYPNNAAIQALTDTVTLRDYRSNSVSQSCYQSIFNSGANQNNTVPTITPVNYKLGATKGPILLKDDGTTEVTTGTETWETDFVYRDRLTPVEFTTTQTGTKACNLLNNIAEDVMYNWNAVNTSSTNAANYSWAKRTVLVDSTGKVVKFDLPVSFTYSDNDPSTKKGLQDITYYGFGDLQIPFACLANCPDLTSMTSMTSSTTQMTMDKMPIYGPEFKIPDNKEIVIKREKADGSGDEDVTFVAVQIEKQEYMTALTDAEKQSSEYKDLTAKKALSVVSTSTLKTSGIGTAPTDATKVCAVDGFPADTNGNPLKEILSEANKALLACK